MRSWEYHPSKSINKSISEKLSVFPRERDMTHSILRCIYGTLLRGFLRTYFRLSIIGKENLPKGQSYVLIANHSSHLDAICLSATVPIKQINRTFSVAAKDYFFSSFWRSFFSAILVNALPFDRKDNKRKSLELCADVLQLSEQVLIMFPEGTRSNTGDIQAFKKGIGILVAGTDRLVIPSYIDGAHQAWPKGNRIPRPKKVIVRLGKPMNFNYLSRTDENYENIAKSTEEAVRMLAENKEGSLC